jgi:L-lactate dehydrogenase complex protein LldG
MSDARERILANLRSANTTARSAVTAAKPLPQEKLSTAQKVEKIKKLLEAVRSEVHVVNRKYWTETLQDLVKQRGIKTLVFAPKTVIGVEVQESWKKKNPAELVPFDGAIEEFKPRLFEMDAAVTGTTGGIAETGVLILQPDENEPRLISLVPPIHFAVLDSEKIFHDFNAAISAQNWVGTEPVNRILISGPSKTADIELTLAFGVHGPRELVVLILE